MGLIKDRRQKREQELRANIIDEVRSELEQRDDTFSLTQVPLFGSVSGNVTEASALSLPAFWRGVSLKTNTISTLPLQGFRGTQQVGRVSLLERPDPTENVTVTLSRLLTSLILRGNAFAILGFDDMGYADALKVVHPDQVSWDKDRAVYVIAGEDYNPAEIMHIRGLTLAGEVFGMGVVEVHRRSLDHGIKIDEFARTYFADNAVPGGTLNVDRSEFSQSDADELVTAWMARQGGRRTPVALPKDITFNPISITNEDSQFLQTKVQSLTDVANIVGVPGYFIGAQTASNTYSNVETEALNLLKFYLRSEMVAVEQAFTELLPEDVEARFNPDALLRTDTKGRYEAHAVAIDKGFLTVNEVRELENREPLAEAAPATPATEGAETQAA